MFRDARRLYRTVTIVLLAIVVIEELRKPPPERGWHGRLFGLVPYDLRFPTLDRVADRVWNPTNPKIFTEHPWGVGWVVNVPSLLALVQDLLSGGNRRAGTL